MSLLPSHHDQFRSKDYWDRFFIERGGEKFEWYGSYKEIEEHVKRTIEKTDRMLIIGCGNSEISADLFDNKYTNITNLDFSPLVIEEMIEKNRNRSSMLWHVGDMTSMPEYGDGTYDIVFDKGALDALMSEDTADVAEKARGMFLEISRLLTNGGKYVCITLAEFFILRALLSHFTAYKWLISVESVQHGKPSPFKPFYITITKQQQQIRSEVDLLVDSFGNDAVTRNITATVAAEEIQRIQEFNQKRFELGEVHVGRFETMDFMAQPQPSSADRKSENRTAEVPRFSVTLLDAANTAVRSCVVFFIPSGRESEFQFSTQAGLSGIAAEAQCRRLLAVRCNRPHVFPAMSLLQTELSPIAMSLKPRNMPSDEAIPYMALEADGNWETLEFGKSKVSGEYIVEEEPDDTRPNGVTRRLVFLQSQNFIQTEVRMIEKKESSSNSKSGSGKGKDKKTSKTAKDKDKKSKEEVTMEFDYSYLDDHHRAVLTSLALTPDIIRKGSKSTHKPSAVPSAPSSSSTSSSSSSSSLLKDPSPLGVIIGLGGGAMPMCLQRYLPSMRLTTCEMDGDMHGIAVKHFAFKCNPRCSVVICEGMGLLERIVKRSKQKQQQDVPRPAAQPLDSNALTGTGTGTRAGVVLEEVNSAEPSDQLDFLFIDADSKDSSLGLSAPPKSFITASALHTLFEVMSPGGMLAVNVAARTVSLLEELVKDVKKAFAQGDNEEEILWKEKIKIEIKEQEKGVGDAVHNSSSSSSSNSNNGAASIEWSRSSVYLLKASDETANTTLLVIKGGVKVQSVQERTPKAPAGKKKTSRPPVADSSEASCKTNREEIIQEWLTAVGLPADPLDLGSLIPKLKLA